MVGVCVGWSIGVAVGLAVGARTRRLQADVIRLQRASMEEWTDAFEAAVQANERSADVFRLGREAVQAVQAWWALEGEGGRDHDRFLTDELTRIRDEVERLG